MRDNALGLVETKGLVGAIVAADAAAKAAAVVISSAELTDATFFTLRIEGELGAVQAAVEAAVEAAQSLCELIAVTVIPRPDDGLEPILPPRRWVNKYHPKDNRPPLSYDEVEPDMGSGVARPPKLPTPRSGGSPAAAKTPPRTDETSDTQATSEPRTMAELEAMPVATLRRYARRLAGFPLKGREISKANKQTLIEELRSFLQKG